MPQYDFAEVNIYASKALTDFELFQVYNKKHRKKFDSIRKKLLTIEIVVRANTDIKYKYNRMFK